MLTKLGEDHDAEFIAQEMNKYHVENICLHQSKHHTDFSTIMSSTKEKDRIIYTFKEASRDLESGDFKRQDLAAPWLYIGSVMGKSFQVASAIVKNTKSSVLFNPSLYLAQKGKTFLSPILRKTKVLVLNLEEAQAVLANYSGKIEYLLLKLHRLGPEIVIITNGEKSVHALSQNIFYSLIFFYVVELKLLLNN